MIFTMDVGNTNIKTALFEGREMRNYWTSPPIPPTPRTNTG